MTIFNVSKDSPAQQVWQSAWGPGLIVSTDIQYPVYIGIGTPNVTSSSDVLGALATMAVTGDQDIYASTLDATVTVEVQSMPGVTSWTPPPPVVATAFGDTLSAPATVHTFTEAGRIWGVELSVAAASNGAYSAGFSPGQAQVVDDLTSNLLLACDYCLSGASQAVTADAALQLPGLVVAKGTVISIAFPSGAPVDGYQSAVAVLYYSVP